MDLTDRQQYELLAAISARGEIPVKFVYLGNGAQRWDDIYRDADYSDGINSSEMSLIMNHIKSFLQAFNGADGINLIDLGCGNGLPAIDIMKQIKAQNLSINYVAVDISQEMLALAARNIGQELPDVSMTQLQLDFENDSLTSKLLDIKQSSRKPNLLINLGNTLGNYVNVSSVLTNFLQSMTLEDYLLIGNGLINDQNPQRILASYDGVESVKQAVTAPAQALGLFTGQDDYRVLWNSSERRVELRIKLNSERELSLAGQSMTMESGDEILVAQSRKYTEASLTKLLSAVGFRTELLTTDRNRSYILAMVQPTRYSAS